jgi:hypothetical protein
MQSVVHSIFFFCYAFTGSVSQSPALQILPHNDFCVIFCSTLISGFSSHFTATCQFNNHYWFIYPYFGSFLRILFHMRWSSGQSSWLQIQRSRFNSRHYQIFWKVVGLEQGSLGLLSTIEELLGRKSSGSILEDRDYGRRGSTTLTLWHSISKHWH